MSDVLTSDDVRVLREARAVLTAVADRAAEARWTAGYAVTDPDPSAYSLGRLAEACDMAEEAIFNVMNTARTYCEFKLTDDEMFTKLTPITRPVSVLTVVPEEERT